MASHGEDISDDGSIVFEIPVRNQRSPYEIMVMDVVGPSFWENDNEMRIESEPNAEARAFYDMLNAARKPLWEGCEEESLLSATMKLLSIKANTNMSQQFYNAVSNWAKIGRAHV